MLYFDFCRVMKRQKQASVKVLHEYQQEVKLGSTTSHSDLHESDLFSLAGIKIFLHTFTQQNRSEAYTDFFVGNLNYLRIIELHNSQKMNEAKIQ